jgi:hypothetical protein
MAAVNLLTGAQVFAWSSNQSTDWICGMINNTGYLYNAGLSTNNILPQQTAPAIVYAILRNAGGFLAVKSGGAARLGYVDNSNVTANPRPAIINYSDNLLAYDYVRVAQLPAPWDTEYGIATNRVASAAASETTTSEADAIVEASWTAVTGQTWELDIRRTDDNNRWCVRCDQAGSTVKLIQIEAGVETERSSAAQTWTNGTAYRLVVICDTQAIRTYVANISKNTYTSASFNQTATGVKTSHAVSDLVAWPRVLSGAALAALEAV